MNESNMLAIATGLYGITMVLYFVALVFRKETAARAAFVSETAATAFLAAGIGARWFASHKMGYGHIPLSNLYESLLFFALSISVIHIYIQKKYHIRIIGAVGALIPFLVMAYASLPSVSTDIKPLIPALQSNWLAVHVSTCFLGYAAFALAFGVSILYLLKSSGRAKEFTRILPPLHILDELTYQLVVFGFLFLSIGIITGAIWANQAWGRYWGWDPKETWSFITWLIYAVMLHARFAKGWKGKAIAYLSCIGFMAVLFTYFGVNLLPGLHSYQ